MGRPGCLLEAPGAPREVRPPKAAQRHSKETVWVVWGCLLEVSGPPLGGLRAPKGTPKSLQGRGQYEASVLKLTQTKTLLSLSLSLYFSCSLFPPPLLSPTIQSLSRYLFWKASAAPDEVQTCTSFLLCLSVSLSPFLPVSPPPSISSLLSYPFLSIPLALFFRHHFSLRPFQSLSHYLFGKASAAPHEVQICTSFLLCLSVSLSPFLPVSLPPLSPSLLLTLLSIHLSLQSLENSTPKGFPCLCALSVVICVFVGDISYTS